MAVLTVKNDSGQVHQVDEDKIHEAEKDGYLTVVSDGDNEHRVSYSDLSLAKKDGFSPVSGAKYDYSNLPKDLVKGQVDALPIYGQALGSTFGTVGAGMGQAAGNSLKNTLYGLHDLATGKRSLEDEFRLPTSEEVAGVTNDAMKNFNQGAAFDMGGKIFGKGIEAAANTKAGQAVIEGAGKAVDTVNGGLKGIANAIRPAQQKPNAEEIIAAGKALGIDVTPGMLDNTEFVSRMEDRLSKSPSWLGQSVLKRQQAIAVALKNTVSDLTSNASDLTPNQLGEKVQEGMVKNVQDKLEPISKTFDDIRSSTQNIPIGERPVSAVVRNIQNIPSYRLTEGAGKPGKYVEMIGRAQNADDIKTIMTMLNGDMSSPSVDSAEKYVLSEIKDKLSRLETNSITRAAIQQAKDSGGITGRGAKLTEDGAKEAAKEVISNLGDARTGYRELSGNLSEIAQGAKIAKNVNPSGFIGKVEALQPEEVSKKFFKENNQNLLDGLQKQFPDQFELLKQGKIKEILDSATNTTLNGTGDLSAQRFLNAVKKINPEGQSSIFGSEGVQKIGNLKTVQQAMTKNFNPSGTASAMGYKDALMANIKDIPDYLLYKGASNNLANNVRTNLLKLPSMLEISKSNPKVFAELVDRVVATKATEQSQKSDEPKGQDKWIDDGIKKIQDHDKLGELKDTFAELKKSKQGKELLMRASDLQPGSKGLDSVIEQIKNTDAYKSTLPKVSKFTFPKKISKDGFSAVVNNDQELDEAKKEGWIW